MNKTNDFKFNLPAYSDPVDVADLNDNFIGIDDALMAGLCKKEYTGNNMGSSDPSARKYAWAPWFEIVNDNEFDVVVTDRNAPVESEEATINIVAGQTFRKYINGRYYMNFYVQDQHDVTFKWFTNAETYINESGGGGGGTGTVTSVSVQGGSGSHLTASGNPIETSGTITINVDEGYSIPSDNEQTAWDGKAADLKLEINSSTYVITAQLKDSSGNLIGNERTIDLPLESVVVSGTYDDQTKKVILTLQNGSTIEFSVADLVSGLQTELSASNKLDPDYIDYDASHRAVSDTEKDTWSGKQNALTFDDTPTQNSNNPVKSGGIYTALTGKQASLDNTQLAAVNSGIDSTKVAQISTNQTNILYAIKTGVKNQLKLTGDVWNPNTLYVYWDYENGTVRVTGSKATTSTVFINLGSWTAPEDGVYRLYANGLACTANIRVFDDANWNTYTAGGDSNEATWTKGTTRTVYIRIASGVVVGDITVTPMICQKSVFDADPTFAPYSAPNSDLTYLEAEDRAALAEVVDSGAKNIATESDFTYVTPSSGVNIYKRIKLDNCTAGTYVISFTSLTSTDTDSDVCYIGFDNAQSQTLAWTEIPRGTNVSVTLATPSTVTYLFIKAAARKASSFDDTLTATGLMVCTKAAFGVSPKFVPYKQDPFYQIPINHNMIYRGKNLGNTLTDSQHTALSSGNFTDLYLGDYWTKTVTIPAGTYTGGDRKEVTVPAQTNITLKAVIADFDTFYAGYASSYAGINTHHAAVIVTGFSNVVWNGTDSTAGGYVNSLIHKWLVGSVLPQMETWFGSAKVLSHQKLLTNAITGDAASDWAWSSQKISLLSENQMYGSKVWGGSQATNGGYEPGEAFKHLNVFNHIDANLLFGNKNIWLRDIASAVRAAGLRDCGYARNFVASNATFAPAALILLS